MTRLRSFLALSPAERRLLVRAMLAVQLVKLGMGLLPFRMLRRVLMRVSAVHRGGPFPDIPQADRVAWAVAVASDRTIGPTTCLVKGLAAQVVLASHGHAARLHFGVKRGPEGGVQAHAWVECRDGIVVGGPAQEIEGYVPLFALGPETP